jgi:hypothetical protein
VPGTSGRTRALPTEAKVVLGVGALFSGAALLTTIVTHAPLSLTLAILFAFVSGVGYWRLRGLTPDQRRVVRQRAATGLLGGVLGVLAYDLTRLAVVTLFNFQIHPFDTFPIFGQLIIGGDKGPAQWVVGTGYHYLNGVMFAVGLCILLPGRNWLFGVAWALGLEAFTLTFYPGWLHMSDIVLQEFTVVSMTGHLAYGTTIGLINQLRLGRGRSGPG